MLVNKSRLLAKAICFKGFIGYSIILPRINFGVSRQESSQQSLTAYSLYHLRSSFHRSALQTDDFLEDRPCNNFSTGAPLPNESSRLVAGRRKKVSGREKTMGSNKITQQDYVL